MTPRLLVITPARNEAAHLPAVIEGMARQRRPPDRWVIVDDRSTDGTLELAREAARTLPFADVLEAPVFREDAGDRLAVAAEARAFTWALGRQDPGWDFVAKLDADIVLAPEHYERLLDAFADDPALGIAGCFLEQAEHDGAVRLQPMPAYHVNGALKTYRRACLEAIGGIPERLGWDTIDETHARMLGWRTRSLRDLRALHLRPSGSAAGQLRGRARHGAVVWIAGYPPALVLARGVRLMAARPRVLSGLAFVAGWARAALHGQGRIEDPELLRFARAEQRARMRALARRLSAAVPAAGRRAAARTRRP